MLKRSRRQAINPTLYGLLAVATFITAGRINFVLNYCANVTTRKEIGIRKTLGGSRAQLVVQFLAETFIADIEVTAILSLLLTPLILQIFADFIPEGLVQSYRQPAVMWLFTGGSCCWCL